MNPVDTVHLLKECDAGVKMAIASFDEVIGKVKEPELLKLLEKNKEEHIAYETECHNRLIVEGEEDKNPNPMAKAMSYMKINMKMLPEPTDHEIAELIFDGCNMGVKSLFKYLHQYKAASEEAKKLTEDIITSEESLRESLKEYI